MTLAFAMCSKAVCARAGNRVRISGQLIDAGTGAHLWADRFDSQLEDIFDLQDRVTSSVIGAISPQLERAEIARAQRKPTESLQAYDYYLRALASSYRFTREENIEALKLTKIASGLDPEFALSYALGAFSYAQRKAFGWTVDAAQEIAEARRLARRAIELDKDDPSVLTMAGHAFAYVVGEVEEGAALVSRAINLDPNLVTARYWRGWAHIYLGDVDAAIEQFQVALRLSPLDPRIYVIQTGLAYGHFFAGRNEEASTWAATAIRQQPNFLVAQRIMMACHAMSGRVRKHGRRACSRCSWTPPNAFPESRTGPHFAGKISKDWRKLTGSRACQNDRLWQVFGCRHDDAIHALRRPASEKRQGTKSREVGHRRCRGRYGELAAVRDLSAE